MKHSKKIIIVSAMGLILNSPIAWAESVNNIVAKMRASGYTNIQTSKTLFGNDRVVGYFQGREHEIVLDGTGRVVRNHLEGGPSAIKSTDDGGEYDAIGNHVDDDNDGDRDDDRKKSKRKDRDHDEDDDDDDDHDDKDRDRDDDDKDRDDDRDDDDDDDDDDRDDDDRKKSKRKDRDHDDDDD